MQYRFARRAAQVRSEKEMREATINTSLDAMLNASSRKGEYAFIPHEGLTEFFRKALSLSIFTRELNNGVEVNRALAVVENGGKTRKFELRVFGTDKQLLPDKEFTTEEIAGLTFGNCKCDDEWVGNTYETGGESVDAIPAIYVNIA